MLHNNLQGIPKVSMTLSMHYVRQSCRKSDQMKTMKKQWNKNKMALRNIEEDPGLHSNHCTCSLNTYNNGPGTLVTDPRLHSNHYCTCSLNTYNNGPRALVTDLTISAA